RLAKEFRRLTRLKHASFVEKNGNVADETGLAEIVGDMKHGEAVLEVHGTHFAAHRGAVAGIQGGERLVEEERLGASRQRPCKRHELALTAAQRAHVATRHELK